MVGGLTLRRFSPCPLPFLSTFYPLEGSSGLLIIDHDFCDNNLCDVRLRHVCHRFVLLSQFATNLLCIEFFGAGQKKHSSLSSLSLSTSSVGFGAPQVWKLFSLDLTVIAESGRMDHFPGIFMKCSRQGNRDRKQGLGIGTQTTASLPAVVIFAQLSLTFDLVTRRDLPQ